MNTNTRQRYWRKAVAFAVIYSLILGQTVQSAQAASTDISDVPMAVKNTAGPNIMFTLDDSGSMQFEVVPENNEVFFSFPRPDPLYGAAWGYGSSFSYVARFDSDNRYARYYRTAKFNRLYYDPAKRYVPWTNANQTLMSNAPATGAWHNPYNTGEGTRDLTVNNTQTARWVNNDGGNTGITSVTFYPATYFTWTGTGTLTGPTDGNNTAGNFTKIEIKSANAPFPKGADRTDCAGSTCTYTEEIQNFANWYSYYRSRILLSRAGVGQAFAEVGDEPRIGFAAINKGSATIDGVASPGTVISGVRKFDTTGRTSFYATLYGHVMPSAGTPLRTALDDVGQYFQRTDNNGPWGTSPGVGGGTQAYCRQNYNILMTDGYWTEGTSYDARTTAARANVDNSTGPTITNHNTNPNPATYQYSPANPYSDSYSSTLADVAMYYWNRDLRPDLENKVRTNSLDPAFWQHLVNITVGLGVSGTVSDAAIQSAFTSTPQTITWPNPVGSNAAKVDDLAHAAINSRGGFLNAADPANFASALRSSINNIIGRDAGAAAVAVANANVIAGDNASYASSYNSGTWTGDLSAYPVDLATGQPNLNAPIWTTSAQAQLDLRTPASRKIATYTGTTGTSQGIQFQPTTATTTTKLSTAQQTLLNSSTTPPGLSDGAAVAAYLRGDRSGETAGTYRSRAHLLGDIINAEPVVVREPVANYGDTGYSAFKTTNASRTRIVLQGANDGMLHAFNTATGAEEWAYVPNLVISNLNNLSRKNGFTHKYYVDGTPVSGDVDFSKTDGITGNPAADWRTIVAGGLGKGGRGYYALDVTSTTAADEAAVAGKVLWEFPNSATSATVRANVGYSYGRPIIVKTKASGWVVLVTSGYNNGTNTGDSGGDGQGYLFVLNARTGALIKALGTGVGSVTDPSGLAHISGYVESSDIDNTVEYVYGGDLKGNVWRFDLTHLSNVNQWSVTKLATLVDGAGNFQPVTTEPELARVNIGSGVYKRFVYVGTGLYLGDTDISGAAGANAHASQTQTMYGLVDDLSNPAGSSPVITPLRTSLQQQTFTVNVGGSRTASATAVDFVTKKGWYIDLPSTGERANTHPALALGALVFTSNIPSTDACLPGGSSFFNVLDYQTGGYLTGSTVSWSSISLGDTLASRVVLIKLPSGAVMGLARKSDASTVTVTVPLSSSSSGTKRKSWRELM